VNLTDRFYTVFGIGPRRRHFNEKLTRYFAGDLDPIERTAFEQEVETSRFRKRVFEAEYDYRTREAGLLALTQSDPDMRECFSMHTLEAFVRGELPPEHRKVVDHHLPCPVCGIQVEALREELPHRVETTWGERFEEAFGRVLGVALRPEGLVAAMAAVLVSVSVAKIELPDDVGMRARSSLRTLGDGTTSLTVEAITSDEETIEIESRDGVTVPHQARLQIRQAGPQLDEPRYFALFSVDRVGAATWHIPTWSGLVPPQMQRISPTQPDQRWIEAEPRLQTGQHQLGLLLSPEPVNLVELRAALEGQIGESGLAGLRSILDERATLLLWTVDVP